MHSQPALRPATPAPLSPTHSSTHWPAPRRWYQEVGRAGGAEPLFMRRQWHMPELDCPPGRDPQQEVRAWLWWAVCAGEGVQDASAVAGCPLLWRCAGGPARPTPFAVRRRRSTSGARRAARRCGPSAWGCLTGARAASSRPPSTGTAPSTGLPRRRTRAAWCVGAGRGRSGARWRRGCGGQQEQQQEQQQQSVCSNQGSPATNALALPRIPNTDCSTSGTSPALTEC